MHNIETYVEENIELSRRNTANGINGMLFEFILLTDSSVLSGKIGCNL